MKARVKLNPKGLNKLDKNTRTAFVQAVYATKTDIVNAQVIPFDEGTMQNEQTGVDESDSHKGQAKIFTSGVQSRKLYFHPEYDYQKVNNPNARGEWFKPWIDGKKKDFTKKAFAIRLKKLNGG